MEVCKNLKCLSLVKHPEEHKKEIRHPEEHKKEICLRKGIVLVLGGLNWYWE